MSAENGTTMKVVALVAVIALCAGAFAGAAFAYTAISVDTVPELKIGSVFITVGSDSPVTSYGSSTDEFRLDVDYNTLIKKVDSKEKVFYRVADGTVLDSAGAAISYKYGFTASVDQTNQTVTFTGCIAEVDLKAYGKDASGTLKVYGLASASSVPGLSSITYAMKDKDGHDVSFTSISGSTESYFITEAVNLSTTTDTKLYVMASFTVSTLDLSSSETVLGSTYYAPVEPLKYDADVESTPIDERTILDDITIPSMSVVYKFETLSS